MLARGKSSDRTRLGGCGLSECFDRTILIENASYRHSTGSAVRWSERPGWVVISAIVPKRRRLRPYVPERKGQELPDEFLPRYRDREHAEVGFVVPTITLGVEFAAWAVPGRRRWPVDSSPFRLEVRLHLTEELDGQRKAIRCY
jgi:hypothetical protein